MARGGKRPGAGRPKGARDKVTVEIAERAKAHAGDALKALLEIAQTGESEAARVSAACAILDRGYGRPKQATDQTLSGGFWIGWDDGSTASEDPV